MDDIQNNHILTMYDALPEDVQNMVNDLIQFMYKKYVSNEPEDVFQGLSMEKQEELMNRIKDYDENPDNTYSSQEMEEIFIKEYGL